MSNMLPARLLAYLRHTACLSLLAVLAACGGDGNTVVESSGSPNTPGTPAPSASPALHVMAEHTVVQAGGAPVVLTASNDDASWFLQPGSPGRLDATRGASVRYLPPAAGSIEGSTEIQIVARAGTASDQVNLLLEDLPSAAPGAPIPEPVASARLAITADSLHVEPGGEGLLLRVNAAPGSTVQWTLAPGSPGRLSAATGNSVTYLPPAAASAQAMPVMVLAQTDDQQAQLTLTLQGTLGLQLVAGSDFGAGLRDGAGAGARFSGPLGLARDAAGNLYVADTGNHTIRRIAPDNTVTTIAGSPGRAGHVDGNGLNARLNAPAHITLAPDGNLYLTDALAHTIRRVTPAGEVVTVAGAAGMAGDADGQGSAARFNHPLGIGADADGNLYVADSHNSLIRRIAPGGSVSTYAGVRGERALLNGPRTTATFIDPQALAVDALGNVLVSDGFFRPPEPNTIAGRSVIRRIGIDGMVSTLAGAFTPETAEAVDGTGPQARFFGIHDMEANTAGDLVLGTGSIRRVTSQGVVDTLLARAAGRLNQAAGIALDSTGTIYFTDARDHVVRTFDPEGGVATLAGAAPRDGGESAVFRQPQGIAADTGGNLYVADRLNHVIRRVAPDGTVSTLAGSPGEAGGMDGNGAQARFYYPEDVTAGTGGTVYVADSLNYAVRRIAADGTVTTIAGMPGQQGYADGSGQAARFGNLAGIARDADGNLYVADRGNHVIRRISPQGRVSTLAGSPGQSGHQNGTGAAARFSSPGDLTVDTDGNVYVLDGGSTLRRITPEGVVTTIAGSPGQWGETDGTGDAARFYTPRGIAFGADGNLYVADTGNNAIRRVTPAGEVATVAGYGAPGDLAAGYLVRPAGITALGEGMLGLTSGDAVFRLNLP